MAIKLQMKKKHTKN